MHCGTARSRSSRETQVEMKKRNQIARYENSKKCIATTSRIGLLLPNSATPQEEKLTQIRAEQQELLSGFPNYSESNQMRKHATTNHYTTF
jgi:hypothetical protein